MTLTAAVLQQILLSLRSDNGRRFNEQRINPRVGVRGKITIVPLTTDGRPLEVWVRDVSISGIGLLSSRAFPANTRFLARFPKVDEEPLTLTYVVAHCKPVSKGLYVVGSRLAEKPSNAYSSGKTSSKPAGAHKAVSATSANAKPQAAPAAAKGTPPQKPPAPAR